MIRAWLKQSRGYNLDSRQTCDRYAYDLVPQEERRKNKGITINMGFASRGNKKIGKKKKGKKERKKEEKEGGGGRGGGEEEEK